MQAFFVFPFVLRLTALQALVIQSNHWAGGWCSPVVNACDMLVMRSTRALSDIHFPRMDFIGALLCGFPKSAPLVHRHAGKIIYFKQEYWKCVARLDELA